MALKKIEEIIDLAKKKWDLKKVVVAHRVGVLAVGEVAVIIVVAASHRAEVFDACHFIIDTIKDTVPIWKKEVYDDGEVWVSAHP